MADDAAEGDLKNFMKKFPAEDRQKLKEIAGVPADDSDSDSDPPAPPPPELGSGEEEDLSMYPMPDNEEEEEKEEEAEEGATGEVADRGIARSVSSKRKKKKKAPKSTDDTTAEDDVDVEKAAETPTAVAEDDQEDQEAKLKEWERLKEEREAQEAAEAEAEAEAEAALKKKKKKKRRAEPTVDDGVAEEAAPAPPPPVEEEQEEDAEDEKPVARPKCDSCGSSNVRAKAVSADQSVRWLCAPCAVAKHPTSWQAAASAAAQASAITGNPSVAADFAPPPLPGAPEAQPPSQPPKASASEASKATKGKRHRHRRGGDGAGDVGGDENEEEGEEDEGPVEGLAAHELAQFLRGGGSRGLDLDSMTDEKMVALIERELDTDRGSDAAELVLMVLGVQHRVAQDRRVDTDVGLSFKVEAPDKVKYGKVLVVGRFRLYVFGERRDGLLGKKKMGLERKWHWYQLRELTLHPASDSVLLMRFQGPSQLAVSAPIALIKRLVRTARLVCLEAGMTATEAAIGGGNGSKIATGKGSAASSKPVPFVDLPASWILADPERPGGEPPCGNVRSAALAQAQYRGIPPSLPFINYAEQQWRADCRRLLLHEVAGAEPCGGPLQLDLGAVCGALSTNSWFRSFELDGVSMKRRLSAAPVDQGLSASHQERKALHSVGLMMRANRHLTALSLRQLQGVKNFTFIGEALSAAGARSALSAFRLSGNPLSPGSFTRLARAWAQMPGALTALELDDCHLSERHARLLFGSLTANFGASLQLRHLSLAQNQLGLSGGSLAIAKWISCIKGFDSLESLVLRDCSIDLSVVLPPLATLKSLRVIDLSGNGKLGSSAQPAGESVAPFLADVLKDIRPLRRLCLNRCGLKGPAVLNPLMAALARRSPDWGRLDLELAGNHSGQSLTDAFTAAGPALCLRSLDVADNKLSVGALTGLVRTLVRCGQGLDRLVVGQRVKRPQEDTDCLAELFNLITNLQLTDLSLAGDHFYRLPWLFEALQSARSLRHLDLRDTALDDGAVSSLVKCCRWLRTVNLSDNPISYNGWLYLAQWPSQELRQVDGLQHAYRVALPEIYRNASPATISAKRQYLGEKIDQFKVRLSVRRRREPAETDQFLTDFANFVPEGRVPAASVPEHLNFIDPPNMDALEAALLKHQEEVVEE